MTEIAEAPHGMVQFLEPQVPKNPDDALFKVPYPVWNPLAVMEACGVPDLIKNAMIPLLGANFLKQAAQNPQVQQPAKHLPVDETFLLMIESLTPRNMVKRPKEIRTNADYKRWNALRQRQNRKKLNAMLTNSFELHERLKMDLAENIIKLKIMCRTDQGAEDVMQRVSSFLGLGLEIVEGIPELQNFLKEHQEKREVIAEFNVEPYSQYFSQQVSEYQKKFNEYKKTRKESRIPSDLKKKLKDAQTKAKCYILFMDNKRIKKVKLALELNEAELKATVEQWLQRIVEMMKEQLKLTLPTSPFPLPIPITSIKREIETD